MSVVTSLWKSRQSRQAATPKPSPLGLKMGLPVSLDLFDLKLLNDKLQVEFDNYDGVVDAIVRADLGDNTTLWTFWLDSDADGPAYAIQVMAATNDPAKTRDLLVLRPFDRILPGSEREWDAFLGQNGWFRQSEWELDNGTRYKRAWHPDAGLDVQLPEWEERLEHASGRIVKQAVTAMVFMRDIDGTDRSESLLCKAVGTGTDRTVDLWVGLPLSPSQLTA